MCVRSSCTGTCAQLAPALHGCLLADLLGINLCRSELARDLLKDQKIASKLAPTKKVSHLRAAKISHFVRRFAFNPRTLPRKSRSLAPTPFGA